MAHDFLIAFLGAGLMFALLAAATRRLAGGCALESEPGGNAADAADAACAGCSAARRCGGRKDVKEPESGQA